MAAVSSEMALEHPLPELLEAAVERARMRAARSGELEPASTSEETPIPEELSDFVTRILGDGTYAKAVERIGRDDPDLATV
jgi:hypothetical protein